MDRIVQGALRRFTFKIQFKPLTRTQREALFVTEACAGDRQAHSVALATRLADLDQLEAEHCIKPEVRDAQGMGFLTVVAPAAPEG
ncbi:MAG: hypothetical protein KGN32_05520 [Burkholderiales bacterium]|nr:hypothetical protein [Burkholderiales bacterium]